MNFQSIPASKLVPSPKNVRRQPSVSDDELMASIATLGVVQSLVVSSVKKPKGSFAVVAGGRRLAQVNRLIASGTFAPDYQLNCLVTDADANAELISLTENRHREAMNPADEALAFKTLVDKGADVETVAKSMAVTTRYVLGRLRLCELAPAIFEALAAGDITLDVAQAFAVRPERELQQAIFSQFSNYSWSAEQIRTRLTAESVKASSPGAVLVGREAYLAAGGKSEMDLFASVADEDWTSPEILEPLLAQKLEEEGERLARELNIGRVLVFPTSYLPYNATEGYLRYQVDRREPTETQAARLQALQDEIDQYEDHECDSEAEFEEIEAKIEAWQAEIDGIEAGLFNIPDEERANLVQFATLASNGAIVPNGRFFLPREPGSRSTIDPLVPGGGDTPAGEKGMRPLSAKLTASLAEDRTDILRLYIASNPGFAINLLAFLLSDSRDLDSGFAATSGLSGYGHPSASIGTRIPALDELQQGLNVSWQEGSLIERFDKFLALSDDDRVALLAAAVSRAATAGTAATALQSHIAKILEVDVASQWRPTEENYWSQVPAARIHNAFGEIDGEELRNRYSGVRKGELAQAAESIFTGQSVSLEPALRQAASTWVPDAMRFTSQKPARIDDDDQGDDDLEDDGDDSDDDVDNDGENDRDNDGNGAGIDDESVSDADALNPRAAEEEAAQDLAA